MSGMRGTLPLADDEALRNVNRLQRLAFVLEEQLARVAPDESTLRRAGFVCSQVSAEVPSFDEMMAAVAARVGRRVDSDEH
ncbi:MAG: hypothetical protein M1522_05325 [Actinobacteria bacterium]|nr:hypothetical protein [Actinomycetota bacterium]